jgi:hypothetical protein
MSVYGLLRFLDGLLIVGALDIFAVHKVTVGTNCIDAKCWHGRSLISGGSVTGLSVTDAWRKAADGDVFDMG